MALRIVALILLLLAGGGAVYFGAVEPPDFATPSGQTETAALNGAARGSPEAGAIAALKATPRGGEPKFDIARVDPTGVSVFAGSAAPGSTVTVYGDGAPVGSAVADESGDWALTTEYKFASAEAKLTVKTGAPPGQAVADASGASPAPPPAGAQAPGAISKRMMENFETLVDQARRDARGDAAKGGDASPAAAGELAQGKPPAGGAPATAGDMSARSGDAKPETAPSETRTAAAPSTLKAATPADLPPAIPIPITFHYKQTTFTPDGRRAADLLVEYVRLKKFPKITLSGHADEIGGDAYNMELSKDRLDVVERLLRDGGFTGGVDLLPKGKREPFSAVDRSRLTVEEAHQLDRRVELRLAK